jgi:hypothetical protein
MSNMAEAGYKQYSGEVVVRRIVTQQLTALGEDTYEFGVRSEQTGQMELRTWTPRMAIAAIKWLMYRGLRRHHIYVRPSGVTGLILVDDLNRANLAKMAEDGLQPSCVVETSPLNYQAWIRVSATPLSPDLGTAVGELLQTRYDGDPGCKDWRHFGRLAGFRNIKPQHAEEDGTYPFVKLTSCQPCVTPNAEALIEQGCELLNEKLKQRELSMDSLKRRVTHAVPDRSTAFAYEHTKQSLIERMTAPVDLSRVEFALARSLYQAGHAPGEIVHEMLCDESIKQRKNGHVEDYVARTIDAALGLKMGKGN